MENTQPRIATAAGARMPETPAVEPVFDHILLATDLSRASERAAEVAAGLTRAYGARLTVLHVYEVSSATLAGTPHEVAERTWPGGVRARTELDRVVNRLRGRGLRADGALRFGSVAEGIFEVALERRVDLIVTGTHGRKGLARAWYGSIAEQIIRGSAVPVLVVPETIDNVLRLRRPRAGRPEARE